MAATGCFLLTGEGDGEEEERLDKVSSSSSKGMVVVVVDEEIEEEEEVEQMETIAPVLSSSLDGGLLTLLRCKLLKKCLMRSTKKRFT